MRNLRKLTAVMLAVALVLTSMTAVFAATEDTKTTTATEVANADKAAILKELKLYAGTDDKDPAAGLESPLQVQQSLIFLASEFGYKAEAEKLSDEDADKILKKYEDGKDVAEYAKKVVAYSVQEGVMAGTKTNDGKLYIRPKASVTAARFATFMLQAMGYELAGSYTESVGQLKEVDGSKILGTEAGDLSRDAAVGMMYGILTAKTESGKTVSENILAADSSLQTVLSKNSLLPVNGTLTVDSVMAVANNKIKVTLKEAATATAADFAIVKKGTTTAVAVKNVEKESDKVYVVETDALTGGTSYTLTANGASVNFTGIAADNSAPTIVKVTSPDTNTFEVEFSDKMDYATATDIANYTWDKSLKTVKAELNDDRNKVKLTTDTAKRNVYYSLTVANVKNSDGKAISKATRNIKAVEDRTAPRLTSVQVQNNRMVVVKFEDANGMNKTALETLANYSINDLTITSATAYDTLGDSDGKYDTVVLMTDTQTANKSYTLTMENLTDNSVLANSLGKTPRGFRGASEDRTSPTVKQGSIKPENNTSVEIEFSDNNAMDAATLEDVSNYSITYGSETLEVISAKASDTKYPDGYKTKKVTLTTAAQEVGKTYKLEVKAVADEFGNVLKQSGNRYPVYNFIGSRVDTIPPYVVKTEYVSSTEVKLHFDNKVDKATAIDPTNYSFNKDIGAPIKASLEGDDKVVKLTTQTLAANTTYTITMNNIEDKFGNAMSNIKLDLLTNASEIDTTVPSISYIYASNSKEIQISFDEAIKTYPATIEVQKLNSNGNGLAGGAVTFSHAGILDDGRTQVYKTTGTLSTDNYVISATTGRFADAAGNKIVAYTNAPAYAPEIADRVVFAGNNAANDKPRVEYIEQVNVKKLKVTFSEPVELPASAGSLTFKRGNTDIADTHETEWYIERNPIFKANEKLTLTFRSWARDLTGDYAIEMDESANKTEFTTYMEDSVKPVITGVAAIDNYTIEVSYDEELNNPGTYKVTNLYYDNNGKEQTKIISLGLVTKDDNIVKIKTNTKLELANNYYLVPITGATDLAGNREDTKDVRFDFAGSDVVNKELGKGVGTNNAKEIYVTTVRPMTSVMSVIEEGSPDVTLAPLSYTLSDDKKKATIGLPVPIITGKSYVVKVSYGSDTEEITFDGNTPDIGLNLVRTDSNTVTVDLNGYTPADYYATIVSTPGAIAIVGTPTAIGFTFGGATASEYYVVLSRNNDQSTVVYAAKVNPTASSSYQPLVDAAEAAVVSVETLKSAPSITNAQAPIAALATGDQAAYNARIITVVDSAVAIAEGSKTTNDKNTAQALVTALPASADKTALQARIDAIVVTP